MSLLLSVKGRVERVEMQNTQFAILADEEKIAMEGDYFVIAAAAYFFVETYIPDTYCESSIPMQKRFTSRFKRQAKFADNIRKPIINC